MGSLVSLLLFGAIYAVVYVVKNLAPSGGKDAKVFGEEFPEVEVLEPQPEFVAPKPEKTTGKRSSGTRQKRGGASKPVPQPQPQPQRPVEKKTAAHGQDDEKPAAESRLGRLNNKSEAKRAFIYSEIFNRKY